MEEAAIEVDEAAEAQAKAAEAKAAAAVARDEEEAEFNSELVSGDVSAVNEDEATEAEAK